jgi:hypothetical protein
MRLSELQIDEVAVLSSWIADLEIDRDGDVLMTLNNGRAYVVQRAGDDVYRAWTGASSKGKFWHSDIKGNYSVRRVQ